MEEERMSVAIPEAPVSRAVAAAAASLAVAYEVESATPDWEETAMSVVDEARMAVLPEEIATAAEEEAPGAVASPVVWKERVS
jgi:hypothetical protein